MAKRAESRIIRKFVHHVDQGLIVGTEESSGPITLKHIRDALQSILDGVDTDEALGIDRKPGTAPKPHTLWLAIAIHNARENGEKWSVIEIQANDYLRSIGEPELAPSTIKGLPKEYASEIKRRLSIDAMFRRIHELKKSDNSAE